MRPALIASALIAAALAAPAATAQSYGSPPAYGAAAQPDISVGVSPRFAEKARRIGIGERDLADLQRDLDRTVGRALTRAGPGAPVRAELFIEDAVPNRPTFEQYGRNVGLSARSFGLGGASVSGQVMFADGRAVPVSFRWYESDIRYSFANTTWSDAQRAFDMFARRLQRGELQPFGRGEASANAGAFGSRYGY